MSTIRDLKSHFEQMYIPELGSEEGKRLGLKVYEDCLSEFGFSEDDEAPLSVRLAVFMFEEVVKRKNNNTIQR